MYTIDDVIRKLPPGRGIELSAPPYEPVGFGSDIGLAVPSMARHTTDEGYQLFLALEWDGYRLCGYDMTGQGRVPLTDVREILHRRWIDGQPRTIVLQDKREWEGKTAGPGFDQRERFTNVEVLRDRPDVFKLTVLKDAQHNNEYHRESADEIGCHAWVVYYHPRIVKHLAPFVREKHLVRTYHTVGRDKVPKFAMSGKFGTQPRKKRALLSGALSKAYPLRQHIRKHLPANCDYRMHPGYGRTRCDTPAYLQALSHYRVAICTCSIYGYALRKIIEATACGCRVITDLPVDEVLPVIDSNLVRVHPSISADSIGRLVERLCDEYDPAVQENFAEACMQFYDYRVMGRKLADDIERLRVSYNANHLQGR